MTVRAGGRTYATTLTGFVPHSSMHGFRGTDGRTLALSENGVLAGQRWPTNSTCGTAPI
ncbi:putative ABC-transporter domain protein [Mycobacterium ulcerans str. Harvey]|uniref:ABC-transporter domain protein n=1 Tax=Mycobacterium ulcerans str. Harvey TaxID=1299332 RepID=A0ABN0R5Y0_MYCUL|nr:putative ABC-transporter domain protein [Mycobacterium ulcerans str. Harvey]